MSGRNAVTVEIKGLDALQKKMEELPRDVAKKGIRQSLRAGGKIISAAMAAMAPSDTGFLAKHFGIRTKMYSGELAGSVFVGPEGRIDYPESSGYREKVTSSGKKYKVGRIGVAAVARYLEFGTSKMAKHPFMTQAFEVHKENALNAIIKKLRDYLEKAVK